MSQAVHNQRANAGPLNSLKVTEHTLLTNNSSMKIRRTVPNIKSDHPLLSRTFYVDFLGLDVAMNYVQASLDKELSNRPDWNIWKILHETSNR